MEEARFARIGLQRAGEKTPQAARGGIKFGDAMHVHVHMRVESTL